MPINYTDIYYCQELTNKLHDELSLRYDEISEPDYFYIYHGRFEIIINVIFVKVSIKLKNKETIEIKVSTRLLPDEVKNNIDNTLKELGYVDYYTKSKIHTLRKMLILTDMGLNEVVNYVLYQLYRTIRCVYQLQDIVNKRIVQTNDINGISLRNLANNYINNLTSEEALQVIVYTYRLFKSYVKHLTTKEAGKYFLVKDETIIKHDNLDEESFAFKELLYHSQISSNCNFCEDEKFIEFTDNYNLDYCKCFFETEETRKDTFDNLAKIMRFKYGSQGQLEKFIDGFEWVVKYLAAKGRVFTRSDIIDDFYGRSCQTIWNKFNTIVPYHPNFTELGLFTYLKDLDPGTYDFVTPTGTMRRVLVALMTKAINLSDIYEKSFKLNYLVTIDCFARLVAKAQVKYKELNGKGNLRNFALDQMLNIIGYDYDMITRELLKPIKLNYEDSIKQLFIAFNYKLHKNITITKEDIDELYILTDNYYNE